MALNPQFTQIPHLLPSITKPFVRMARKKLQRIQRATRSINGPLSSGSGNKTLPPSTKRHLKRVLPFLKPTVSRPQMANPQKLNLLPAADFGKLFLPPTAFILPDSAASSSTVSDSELVFVSAEDLSDADRQYCVDMIESSNGRYYRNSKQGWDRVQKLEQLKRPDQKYFLLKFKPPPDSIHTKLSGLSNIRGFMAFTIEEGYEEDDGVVIYCYEIHLGCGMKGNGIGSHMMGVLEQIGRKVGLKKAFLTVFAANTSAVRFYKRLGYEVDKATQAGKELRGGRIAPNPEQIMSKML